MTTDSMTATEAPTEIVPTVAQTAFGRYRNAAPIRADDPTARAKLTARITMLEAIRDAMKKLNAAFNMKAIVTGNEKLRAFGMSENTIAVARANGKKLFPGWELQNLGANIKRLERRLEEIAAEEEREVAEDIEGDGYRVVENTELGRIQFLFDAKPDEAIRKILKRNGFRWAPSQEAWQRHLNPNGRYAAGRVQYSLKAA